MRPSENIPLLWIGVVLQSTGLVIQGLDHLARVQANLLPLKGKELQTLSKGLLVGHGVEGADDHGAFGLQRGAQ